MTEKLGNALASLTAEIDAMIVAVQDGQEIDAAPLEARATSLCQAVTTLPGVEARALLEQMDSVITALDALGKAMQNKGARLPDSDKTTEAQEVRAARAVSAYKNTGRY